MRRMYTIAMIVAALAAVSAIQAVSAFAYGQCGSTASTPTAWVANLQHMGVVDQTAAIEASAGFHRMDGSLLSFATQRVVVAPLAEAAAPEDFGCHPNQVFSVGPRKLAKGTPILAALPAKYSKADVSTKARKGWTKIKVTVSAAGKVNCSNPLRGKVKIFLWLKPKKKIMQHKTKKAVKASICKSGISGSCNSQTQTATQTATNDCGGNSGSSKTGCSITQITVQNQYMCTIFVNGVAQQVSQNEVCSTNVYPPAPPVVTPPVVTPPVVTPPTPADVICIKKDVISGPKGTVVISPTVDNMSDVWYRVTAWNCGSNEDANVTFVDTLPKGQTFYKTSVNALGGNVDTNNAVLTWHGVLKQDGTVVTYEYETADNDTLPCGTNLVNTVVATPVHGSSVTSVANLKTSNTSSYCMQQTNGAPPTSGGTGGPWQ